MIFSEPEKRNSRKMPVGALFGRIKAIMAEHQKTSRFSGKEMIEIAKMLTSAHSSKKSD